MRKGIAMSLDAMATSEDVLGHPDQALKDFRGSSGFSHRRNWETRREPATCWRTSRNFM